MVNSVSNTCGQIMQAPKEVEHSGVWIYYNRQGDKIRDKIIDQLENMCQECGCISDEQRLQAKQIVPQLASKIRLYDCFTETFKDLTGPGRFEYRIENSQENFQEWLNAVKAEIKRFAVNFEAMGGVGKSDISNKLENRLRSRGMSEDRISEILNKYLITALKKRVQIENLVEPEAKRMMDQQSSTQAFNEKISDLILGDGRLKIVMYSLGGAQNVSRIQLSEKSNHVLFDHLGTKTVIQGLLDQHPLTTLSCNKQPHKDSSEHFFSKWDDKRERFGLISDSKVAIIGSEWSLNISDGLDNFSAATWCSDNSEYSRLALATKGKIIIIKVPYNLDGPSEEIGKLMGSITTHHKNAYPPSMVSNPIKDDELFISSYGGIAKVNLETEESWPPFIQEGYTWANHISCWSEKILFSLRGKNNMPILRDQKTNENIYLNITGEVIGLHLYENTAVTLHPDAVRLWDIRNTSKEKYFEVFRNSVCTALGANSRELIIGFKSKYYGRLEKVEAY